MVLDEPVRPEHATGLLVGGEDERDGPIGDDAGSLPSAYDRQQHPVEVLHVDRAAAEEVAVDDLGGERVDLPVAGLRGHDVEVPVDQQSGP